MGLSWSGWVSERADSDLHYHLCVRGGGINWKRVSDLLSQHVLQQ